MADNLDLELVLALHNLAISSRVGFDSGFTKSLAGVGDSLVHLRCIDELDLATLHLPGQLKAAAGALDKGPRQNSPGYADDTLKPRRTAGSRVKFAGRNRGSEPRTLWRPAKAPDSPVNSISMGTLRTGRIAFNQPFA